MYRIFLGRHFGHTYDGLDHVLELNGPKDIAQLIPHPNFAPVKLGVIKYDIGLIKSELKKCLHKISNFVTFYG